MKKWVIYAIIALVLLLLIIFAILLLWKWKTKKNNQELKSKIRGGVELEDIIKEIKEKISEQTGNQQTLGFYNLTSDECYNLNIKLDYHENAIGHIDLWKLKGSNTKNHYIIVNGKRMKLKDYVETLMNKNKLNTEPIEIINEHASEVLQYVEHYEEDEAEFYVEQTLKEAEILYDNIIINTIVNQRKNFNKKTIPSEKIEEIGQQIKDFKEMEERLLLVDKCYNDIFSMRQDLRDSKEEIIEKHNKLLKLIIYIEIYYEITNLKKEHTYLSTGIKLDDSEYNTSNKFKTYHIFEDHYTLENIGYPKNSSTFNELILEINKQINICTNQEYLNEISVNINPIEEEENFDEDFPDELELDKEDEADEVVAPAREADEVPEQEDEVPEQEDEVQELKDEPKEELKDEPKEKLKDEPKDKPKQPKWKAATNIMKEKNPELFNALVKKTQQNEEKRKQLKEKTPPAVEAEQPQPEQPQPIPPEQLEPQPIRLQPMQLQQRQLEPQPIQPQSGELKPQRIQLQPMQPKQIWKVKQKKPKDIIEDNPNDRIIDVVIEEVIHIPLIKMASIINSNSNDFKLYYKYPELNDKKFLKYTEHKTLNIDQSNNEIQKFVIEDDYLNKPITNDNYHLKKININDDSRRIIFFHYATDDIKILYNTTIKEHITAW